MFAIRSMVADWAIVSTRRLLALALVVGWAAVAAAMPRATQSVANYTGLTLPPDVELPCRLNLVFLSASAPARAKPADTESVRAEASGVTPARPLRGLRDEHIRSWFGRMDNTVRQRTVYRKRGDGRAQRKWGSHEESELPIFGASFSNDGTPVTRHKYRFHTLRLDPAVAKTLGLFLGRVARREPPGTAEETRYTIDVDEVTPKLAKLVQLLGERGAGIALSSSLFVLDVPVAIGSQPITRYAYRRGWSNAEMALLVKDARIQRAAENAKRRRDEARLGLGFSDDSLLETDVLPADVTPRLSSTKPNLLKINPHGKAVGIATKSSKKETLEWISYMERVVNESKHPKDYHSSESVALRVLNGVSTPRQESLLSAMEWHQRSDDSDFELRRGGSGSSSGTGSSNVGSGVVDLSGCRFDSWISDSRFAWVDLGAEGCTWGEVGASSILSVKGTKLDGSAAMPFSRRSDTEDLQPKEISRQELQLEFSAHANEIDARMEFLLELFEVACQKGSNGRPQNARECEVRGRRLHQAKQLQDAFKDAYAQIRWNEYHADGIKMDSMPLSITQASQAYLDFVDKVSARGNVPTAVSLNESVGGIIPLHLLRTFRRLTNIVSSFMRHVVTPPTAVPPPTLRSPVLSTGRRRDRDGFGYLGNNARESVDDRTIHHAYRSRRKDTIMSFGSAAFMPAAVSARASLVQTTPVHVLDVRRIERVSFHVHLVNVNGRMSFGKEGRATTTSSVLGGFDLALFKRQISQLRAPDQEFSFTFQHVNLNDDPALAMAYHSSMRFTVEPLILTEEEKTRGAPHAGVLQSRRRRYLNALHLRHQLRVIRQQEMTREAADSNPRNPGRDGRNTLREPNVNVDVFSPGALGEDRGLAGGTARRRENLLTSRNIPIFIFAYESESSIMDMAEDLPVLIDRHYVARATPDMVFVTQHTGTSNYDGDQDGGSEETSPLLPTGLHWKTLVSCNNRPLRGNLVNPVRETLRATATVLGGLLPAHVGRQHKLQSRSTSATSRFPPAAASEPRQYHDWTWAIGKSPLALTETGPGVASFSRLNIDALHRAQALQGLEAARIMLKASLKTLSGAKMRSGKSGGVAHSLSAVVLHLPFDMQRPLGNDGERHHSEYDHRHPDAPDFDAWWRSEMKLAEGLQLLQERWRSVVTAEQGMKEDIDRFDYASALRRVAPMLRASRETMAMAETIAASLEPHACADERVVRSWKEFEKGFLRAALGVAGMVATGLLVLAVVVSLVREIMCRSNSQSRRGSFFSKSTKTVKIN